MDMVIGHVRTVAERRWYGSSTTISSTNSSMTAGSEGAVSNMLTPEVGWLRCLVELINFDIGNSFQSLEHRYSINSLTKAATLGLGHIDNVPVADGLAERALPLLLALVPTLQQLLLKWIPSLCTIRY